MKALFASSNQGKFLELSETLALWGIELESARDHPRLAHALPEVIEDGATYLENALIKARHARQVLEQEGIARVVIADDSGLEVQALHGAPGLHSARYAGTGASAAENRARLIRELTELAARQGQTPAFPACFRCVLVALDETGAVATGEGEVHGVIILTERGQGGFGYDPLFVPTGERLTLAELKAEGALHETHRTRAAKALAALLRHSRHV